MNLYLSFPDSAQFADIARNILLGLGYGSNTTFWDRNIFETIQNSIFPSPWVPPVMPISIAAVFRILGVNDISVIVTATIYYVLLLVFTFLLSKKIFNSNFVGFVSSLAVGVNQSILSYVLSGASEIPFMFEIVAAMYLLLIRKKWGTVASFVLMFLMYFTRPQAFIYISGLLLCYYFSRFPTKKAVLLFAASLLGGLVVDFFVLNPLAGKYFLYPILMRGLTTFNQAVISASTSEFLRGASPSYPVIQIAKKVFYNLYNFYKLLPDIISPYLFGLFVIGLFIKIGKDRDHFAFKISVLYIVLATFFVTAITIPLYRYIHPIIPMIYIYAIGVLAIILKQINKSNSIVYSLVLFTIVAFFCIGQSLGVWFLDSRAVAKSINKNQPPVYYTLSKILKDNTNFENIVLTNLNSWGSWYGERKTVWYPLEPNMIIPPNEGENNFDAIYLTSYLMDDENSYMGVEWREIFENPTEIKNDYISKHYKLKGIYQINAADNYENIEAKSVLLIKK